MVKRTRSLSPPPLPGSDEPEPRWGLVKTTLRFPREMHGKLEELAHRRRVRISTLVLHAVRRMLAEVDDG